MWTREQQLRLALEKKLMEQQLSQFQFYNLTGRTYISGWQSTSGNEGNYKLKLVLPARFPYERPRLYVVSPRILWQYGWTTTINSLGTSHDFHTWDNGPKGCVQICHTREWSSSITCVLIMIKGIAWLEAYSAHMRTGDILANFVC